MRKKIFLIYIFFISCIFTFATKSYAISDYYTVTNGIGSDNSGNRYITYDSPVKSNLYANTDGTLTRVEYLSDKNTIIVENYNTDFKVIEKKNIPMELELFGGFYSGKDYNFFVFGKNNLEEDDSIEVVRVVKYSKNWNRLDSISLKGINTYRIFRGGSCRMTETNGILFIYTCHEMYSKYGRSKSSIKFIYKN